MNLDAYPVPPYVRLQMLGLPAGVTSWRITATYGEGSYTVRGNPGPAFDQPFTDYQAPLSDPPALSRPISYHAQVFNAAGAQLAVADDTSDPVIYPGARLTDSERPGVGMDVVVESQTPGEWQPRSIYYDVLDRDDPVVAMQSARLRSGTLTLLTTTTPERTQLRDLLRGGSPLMLRTTEPDRVDDTMLLATRIAADDRVQLDARRRWTVEYQAVSVDQGAYSPPPARTYATALADSRFPTFASLFAVQTTPDWLFNYFDDYRTGNATYWTGGL